jgi:hypothetical protein
VIPSYLKQRDGQRAPPLVEVNQAIKAWSVDADPDPDFYLMRIRFRLFTLMRILIQILSSQKRLKPFKNVQIGSDSIHFDLSSAN